MATQQLEAGRVTPRSPVGIDRYDTGGATHVQWGAVLAGSLAGFGVTLLMGTLGAAIGISAGAALADEPMGTSAAEGAAVGFGIGAAVWTLLTAAVVGFSGGAVLSRMARYDRPYMPVAFGALTWAGGMLLALLVAAPGVTGLFTAAGGGAAGIAAARTGEQARPGERMAERAPAAMTPEERAKAADRAETAAKATATLAWVALGAQLVSLAATMLAAGWRKVREIPVRMGVQPASA